MSFPLSAGGPLVPQRISLVTQTVEMLKESIHAGVWLGYLPGEHELCEHLHVSRVTLRKALDELQREGWVRSSQGRRRKIIPRPRRSLAASNRVVLLTALPLHSLHPFTIYWMDSLRKDLSEAGFQLEIHVGQTSFGSNPEPSLSQMQKRLHPAGWVLYRSNEPMQQWFSKHVLPCVIAGSRHPHVQLPSVDVDYRACCRHAVGQFLARKHKQLVFLNPDSGAAGDLKSEQGFLETVKTTSGKGVSATVVRHDSTVSGICNKLDLLLQRPQPPTALLVSRPPFVLTAMSHLLRRKVAIPDTLALISRDNDSLLESMVPTIARYTYSPTAFARKVSRLVLQMARGATLPRDNTLVIPSFVAGQTLG